MASQPNTIRASHVSVKFGDMNFRLPSSPMGRAGAEQRSLELRAGEGDTLVLAPIEVQTSHFKILMAILALIAAVSIPIAWAWPWIRSPNSPDRISGVVAATTIVSLFGYGILSRLSWGTWVVFDRSAGLVSFKKRPFGILREPRVLSTTAIVDIVCVQLVDDEITLGPDTVGEEGNSIFRARPSHARELNLAVASEWDHRIALAIHSDGRWIREVGSRLAAYLRVPLVDQLGHGA